jgi:dTMP kinase
VSARGLLVSFEGGEGSGKTTQAERLQRRLEAVKQRALLIREPGGTPLGEELREILLHRRAGLAPETELLLFLAARAELVRRVIEPALADGQIVVCDRFSDSTLAYQGFARGLDVAAIRSLNEWATGGLMPGLTLLLDTPVEVGLRRQLDEDDAFAREDAAFHTRVRDGYLSLADADPTRWRVLDATQPPDAVEAQVWAAVEAKLSA